MRNSPFATDDMMRVGMMENGDEKDLTHHPRYAKPVGATMTVRKFVPQWQRHMVAEVRFLILRDPISLE